MQAIKSHREPGRRQFLKLAGAAGLMGTTGATLAQSIPFNMNSRYPDPAVQILDPSFVR